MIAGHSGTTVTQSLRPSRWRDAARWWHLLRHHHPSQLAMRLFCRVHNRAVRRLWHRRMERPLAEVPPLRANSGLAALSRRRLDHRAGLDESRARAEQVFEGRFRFLRCEIASPNPVDWRGEGTEVTHLWRFHLHYHDYLVDLAAQGKLRVPVHGAARAVFSAPWEGDGPIFGAETVDHSAKTPFVPRKLGESPCERLPFRDEDQWLDRAWALVTDWIEANRLDDRRVLGDAWHPYCISRRLPAWIHLWSAAPPDEAIREGVITSMVWQARYLERHLEWDLRGNHLLENLRALALMGAFFEGPDARRWLHKAAEWLPQQLAEQILPHGEHFERSPGYHADMLEAVLEVRDATSGILPELAHLCGNAAARMAAFLRDILHPDGDIPLLGDSCLGRRESIGQLLQWACGDVTVHGAARAVFSTPREGDSPIFSAETGNHWAKSLCVPRRLGQSARERLRGDDVPSGRPVRTSLPEAELVSVVGHRSLDRLASSRRCARELACDACGPTTIPRDLDPPYVRAADKAEARVVGDYWLYRHAGDFLLFDAGPVGADQLPAHAHADLLTLEASIDGRRLLVDSGVFSYDDEPVRRYCRSTAAHNVLQVDQADQCDIWSRFRMGYRGWPTGFEAGREHGFSWARASHNAYRRLGVPKVGRWLACRPGGPWLCVDWAHGAGRHRLTSWLHFHPEVKVKLLEDNAVQLELAGRRLQLHWLAPGDVAIEAGCYCPELGKRQTAPVVRWEANVPLPAVCGWYLTWEGSEGMACLAASSSSQTVLRWTEDDATAEFCWLQ